jgi:serine/threonine protein kinase
MATLIGKQIGRYQIEALLGEGGMGAVYRAYDLQAGQHVALKVMLSNLVNKPQYLQRFTHEAQTVSQFNSPAIIKVLDTDTFEGTPYIVMELIEGGSLTHYMRQLHWAGKRLNLEEVITLAAQIAEGLSYAHQRGLIHRDIKPENILLRLRDGSTGPPRQAVITDFGLAMLLKQGAEAATNPFMGSFAYMSPEQCENAPLDGRSDVYSAGILLYQLTTGQAPFQINSPSDIVKHLQEQPLPPRLLNPDLPQIIEDIVLKAMAKKPGDRFQTAAEMAHALRQSLSNLENAAFAAIPGSVQPAQVTQWLENKWIAGVNVQDRVDMNKTWTSEGSYRLFVAHQVEESRIYALSKDEIRIGRSTDNDVVLEDRTVSAHHVTLKRIPAGWQVVDLGSTNGTLLEDRQLGFDEGVVWEHYDVLRIGPYFLQWQLFAGESDVHRAALPAAMTMAMAVPPNGNGNGSSSSRGTAVATGVGSAVGVAAVAAAASASGGAQPDALLMAAALSEGKTLVVTATPNSIVLEPEIELPWQITVKNLDITVQEVRLRVYTDLGITPSWIRMPDTVLKLLPEEVELVTAVTLLPQGSNLPAGNLAVHVEAMTDKGERATTQIQFVVNQLEQFDIDMHPSNLQENVTCRLTIRDHGNFVNQYTVMGLDDADALVFDFDEPQNATLISFDQQKFEQQIRVEPGQEVHLGFTLRPRKRPWFGSNKILPYKLRLRSTNTDWQTLVGQVEITPRITRRILLLLLLFLILLLLLGFWGYSVFTARDAARQQEIQATASVLAATATAAQLNANLRLEEAAAAEATAQFLRDSGQDELALSAQATADALRLLADEAQLSADSLEQQLSEIAAEVNVTPTPLPPPTDIVLDVQLVAEGSPIGTTVGTFTVVFAAPEGAVPAGVGAGGKPNGLFRLPQQAVPFTLSLVSGSGDDHNDLFFIDGETLKTAAIFDFETDTSFSVRVQADNGAGGVLAKAFVISVADEDDTPTLSVSGVTVDEDAGVAAITVEMVGTTQSEVTVDVATEDGTAEAGDDYEESEATLTWEPEETGAKTVEVAIVDDTLDETTETFTVVLSNAEIAIIEVSSAQVTISDDDDTPAITVTDVSVDEDAGTAVVIVTLTGKSSSDVTVNYATANGTALSGSDYTSAAGTLSWEPDEEGEQEIEITLADDVVDELDETISLILSSVSNALIEDGTGVVTIVDDDDPPTIAIEDVGPVAETGTAVVTVRITGASSREVSVAFATTSGTATAGADFTTTSGTLTWAPESTTAQQINVPILVDTVFESPDETFTIKLSNPVNATMSDDEGTYTITDDDTRPTLEILDALTTESAGTVDLQVRLNGGANTAVTVDYATVDGVATAGPDYVQASSPPQLTWLANEQNAIRTIQLTINEDSIDEGTGELFQVNLSNNSANSTILDGTATVIIEDNDTAGITVSRSTLTVAEPTGTGTFRITLASEPAADVVIPVTTSSTSGRTECSVTPSVTLNASNWNSGATVTVTAVNDDIDDDSQTCDVETGDPTSADAIYDAFTENSVADVAVTVNDDDTAAIRVQPTNLTISETAPANTATFVISLTTQPINPPVIISLASSDTQQCTVSATQALLTVDNWRTGLTFTVTAVDEEIIDASNNCLIVTGSPNTTDPQYSAITTVDDVTVTVQDNDRADATVQPTTLTISETVAASNYTAVFTIALTSRPSAAVTFPLSAPSGQCTVPGSISFNSGNVEWRGKQVVVTAVNDDVSDGNQPCLVITDMATSTDNNYNNIVNPADVTVTVLDDDLPGVTIVQSDGGTDATEGGALDTYTLVLQSQPTHDVTITLQPNAQLDLGAGAGTAVTHTFTNLDWNIAQNVTVTAFDDNIAEGMYTATITHTSASLDPNYGNSVPFLPGNIVTVYMADNDVAGVTITETDGATAVTEGGAGDNYSLVLTSEPTADVTILVDPNGELSVNGNPANNAVNVTFTPANWDVIQPVSVNANNDTLDETSPHSGVIGHSATSTDPNYNGGGVPFTPGSTLAVDIADDDETPVIDVGQTMNVAETAVANTLISPALTVTDDDTIITWTILSTIPPAAIGYFSINEVTDQLSVTASGAANFDYESGVTAYGITLTASDGTNTSAQQTVTVNLQDMDDEPPVIAGTRQITVTENSSEIITASDLTATDPDVVSGNNFTYTITTPTVGRVQLSSNPGVAISTFTTTDIESGLVDYVHTVANTTADQFNVTATDAGGNVSTNALFSINIEQIDDTAPTVSVNSGRTLNEGATAVINTTHLDATDVDTPVNNLIFEITIAPTNGDVIRAGSPVITFTRGELNSGLISIEHNGSETTSDFFRFVVRDPAGNQTPLTSQFDLVITPVNDPPTVTGETINIDEEASTNTTTTGTNLLSNDTDPDDAPANLTMQTAPVTAPSHGSLTLNSIGTFFYTHDGNDPAAATDSFTYRVCDDNAPTPACTNGTVTINVTAVNDPPNAINDTANNIILGSNNNEINVLDNDTDADGAIDRDTLQIVVAPTIGTATVNAGQDDIRYTAPATTTLFTTSLQYEVCDDGDPLPVQCSTATVTINLVLAAGDREYQIVQQPITLVADWPPSKKGWLAKWN